MDGCRRCLMAEVEVSGNGQQAHAGGLLCNTLARAGGPALSAGCPGSADHLRLRFSTHTSQDSRDSCVPMANINCVWMLKMIRR
jgi:hypothetical protein